MNGSSDALKAAQRHLDAAQFCFSQDRFGLAVAEAYFSMYHATLHAAPENEEPSTHRGVDDVFYWHLVKNGRLSEEDHKSYFNDAREERIRWHYEGKMPLQTTDISGILGAAEEMIELLS